MIDFRKHKHITIIYDDISYKYALEIFECLKLIITNDFNIYDYSKYIFYNIECYEKQLIFINNNIIISDDDGILHDAYDIVLKIFDNKIITNENESFYNDIMIILREIKIKNIIK